jgi:outer membrane protein assembly factor BamB
MILALPIVLATAVAARGDDWPQWLGPQRDSVWRETDILNKFPKDGPKVLWRAKIAGGYAGPAVADGKVYVTDYVTDGDTRKEVFGRTNFKGQERVLCFDAKTGEKVWEHKYDCNYTVSYACGPRATPTIVDGKLYSVGTEGDFYCLDAAKGTELWKKDFKKDFGAKTPMWGFAGHPLVDGKRVVVIPGGENACVVALDKDSGKEVWKALNAVEPGYSCPMIIEAGGKRQLIVWHGTSVNGLNPETGEKYWAVPLTADYKMSIMTPRQAGEFLFAAGNGDQGVLIKLAADKPGASEKWRGKKDTAIYPINMTPFIEDGTIFGVDRPGQFMAVKLENGERLWETTEPVTGKDSKPAGSGTAFVVKNGDRFFLFNEKGEILIARLTAKGYEEIDRAKILEPTGRAFGRDIVWSHPAFANKSAFARNDKEIVCVSLGK